MPIGGFMRALLGGYATSGNAARSFPMASVGNLRYPNDATTKHYIRFYINTHAESKNTLGAGAYNPTPDNSAQNLSVQRPPMKRTLGSITLYLPAQISVSQKANYGEAEIGLAVAAAMGTAKALGEGEFSSEMGEFAKSLDLDKKKVAGEIGEILGATGARAAAAISRGRTTVNRTEMMFEGIDRRTFSFTFRLIPKSAAEAENIKNICYQFRYHSMPHIYGGGTTGRTLVSPSTFDIQYVPGQHLHKISTCALEQVDIKYGGDRPQFFKDDQPSETELTLTFRELEIITKERVQAGY